MRNADSPAFLGVPPGGDPQEGPHSTCPPCLRTPVHHLSGLYTGEGRGGGARNDRHRPVRSRVPSARTSRVPAGEGEGGGARNDCHPRPPSATTFPLPAVGEGQGEGDS
jgi:hypothetical protein